MIPIDKGVPIPEKPKSPRNGQAPVYPWSALDVGDSIFVRTSVQSAMSSASAYGKRNGKQFTSRLFWNGVRIWRTA